MPFYLTKEKLSDIEEPEFKDILEAYSFGFFGPQEIRMIGQTPELNRNESLFLAWLKEDKKCYGVKTNGRIIAFVWIDFKECNYEYDRFRLNEDEAYLFDLYTIKEFRGKNIAPYLHYESYKVLEEMGRTTFYHITELFNIAAIKYKKKMNMKNTKLDLYIEIFRKFRWHWIIKEY